MIAEGYLGKVPVVRQQDALAVNQDWDMRTPVDSVCKIVISVMMHAVYSKESAFNM